jgi:hypothetical protein
MACPFFAPDRPLPWERRQGQLRPPLGELYEGLCRVACDVHRPVGEILVEGCNLGYPGARCARFPTGAPEAVRFAVASDDGERIEVDWLVEKGCLPIESGRARCNRRQPGAAGIDPSSALAAQLRAYVEAYLRSLEASDSNAST